MFLTFLYLVVSGLDSWRYRMLRGHLRPGLLAQGSVLFYRVPKTKAKNALQECTDVTVRGHTSMVDLLAMSIPSSPFSSIFCTSGEGAHIIDFIAEVDGRRACTLFPKQKVSIEAWHPHSSVCTSLVPTSPSSSTPLLDILIEAGLPAQEEEDVTKSCAQIQLLLYGQTQAWKTHPEALGMLLKMTEFDFLRLGMVFLQGIIQVEGGWVLQRITSVEVQGNLENCQSMDCDIPQAQIQDAPKVVVDDVQCPATPASTCSSSKPATVSTRSAFVDCRSRGHSRESSLDSGRDSSPSAVTTEASYGSVGSTPARHSVRTCLTSETASLASSTGRHMNQRSQRSTPVMEGSTKPPNILVYGENELDVVTAMKQLASIVNDNRYTIYHLKKETVFTDPWVDNVRLLVVSGDISDESIATVFIEHYLQGGNMLALCSNIIQGVLPNFKNCKTSDAFGVFNYSQWKNVNLKQRILELERIPQFLTSNLQIGNPVQLSLNVLASDTKYKSPTLLAVSTPSGTVAVFSQICIQGQKEECEDVIILRDVVQKNLKLDCSSKVKVVSYTSAYLLGEHLRKQHLLSELNDHLVDGRFPRQSMSMKFLPKKGTTSDSTATRTYLPVLTQACPETFSTVIYYENLSTEDLGRLVIFCDVITSAMDLLDGTIPLGHGVTVIPRQQTSGKGRSGNKWISPLGCAMFGMQIKIPMSSPLGQRLPFLQHLVALAIVKAILELPGLQDLPLLVKWPNDVYLCTEKIAGVLVTTQIIGNEAVCNIGSGINVSNSVPTYCVHDAIRSLCPKSPLPKMETVLARTFSQLEVLVQKIQNGDLESVVEDYYEHWMHMNSEVTVRSEDGTCIRAVIKGIDEYGFLLVHSTGKEFTVQPDGNSFDLLQGLIFTKTSR